MKNEIQDNRTTEITDFPYGWNKGDTCIIITNKAKKSTYGYIVELVKQAQQKEEHILKEHAGIVHIPEDVEEKVINLRIEILKLEYENEILRKKLRDAGYEV